MRRVNLIPLAGEGRRFANAGYSLPKPLIDVEGLPMVIRSAQSLPHADHWIFICLKSHIQKFDIDKILLKYFPGSTIISVDKTTDGQACTCLLAEKELKLDDQLTIGACDNKMEFNSSEFDKLIIKNDALIWTFKNNPSILHDPEMYGWVSIDDKGKAKGISCKKSISNDPINDHAIVGAFSFKKAESFIKYTMEMIAKNRRVNGEYYLDIVLDECIKSRLNVAPFLITQYIGWGTPKELQDK